MTGVVSWAVLSRDGSIEKGTGTEPPPGWFNRVKVSAGVALQVAGFPPVYAVRPTCSNDVDVAVTASGDQIKTRFWGIAPEPGAQVWLWPNAALLGIGKSTTEVNRLVLAFQGKVEAERVSRGPDQRNLAQPIPLG